MSANVHQVHTDAPDVLAFRIAGEVDAETMAAIADPINAAFDKFDTVALLLIFDHYEGRTVGAGLTMTTLRAQLRGLSKIRKYALVGAPDTVGDAVAAAGDWTGIETASFDLSEEPAAWRFVGAQVANV